MSLFSSLYVHLLLINSKPPQILHLHPLQRPLICRLKHYLRHLTIRIPRPRVERFFPPIHTQTPFTSVCEAGLTEVVTPRGAEVEELVGYDGWVA
jgi:hypothetical protein